MNSFEQFLAEFYKSDYCCTTSNGTTAMYLFFQALGMQKKTVLYPAISCTNPVNAAVYAGYSVHFCDVNTDDYTIDLDILEEMLRHRNDIGVVVPTHIYGHLYDREKVKSLCDKYDIFLLEDAAQTTEIGMADASIVSFGHTKIFESGSGGAIFVKDKALCDRMVIERAKLQNTLILPSEDAFNQYRERYYTIVNNPEVTEETIRYKQLYSLQLDAKQYFVYDLPINQRCVMARLQRKKYIVKSRIQKALLYKEKLNKRFARLPQIDYSSQVVWRFTFLVPKNREKILIQARAQNIDISSWYPSLNKIYVPEQSCPCAEYISDHVVNLWVDETHSLSQIKVEIDAINKIMEEVCHE